MDVACNSGCPILLSSACVFYESTNLLYTGINTNDTLQTALQKIDQAFESASIGYAFINGLEVISTNQVGLGGSLLNDTEITGNYLLTFEGQLESSAFITTGGTSSDFVKGDGSLDSTSYQPAGNYITALTGDATASGPGSAALTLATVFGAAGTYGDDITVPQITVDLKGRITNVVSVPIDIPSDSLSFQGDVTGLGVTGAPVTLTLNTVNTNVFGPGNFPLKFAVNAKGLITSAALLTNLDIDGLYGYTPVPTTRTITINGDTKNLAANRSWTIAGGSGTVTSVSVTPGTGISASVADPTVAPNITITNTAPDQIVALTAGTDIGITGTYPNFTISYTGVAPTNFITSVSDTNTVDLDVTLTNLTANIRYQNTATINLSDDASGLKADFASLNISQFTNNSNYITLSNVLTGLSISGTTITAANTVIQAFGALQNQINGLIGGVIYQGTWNATTNSPTLTSSVGTKGYYYIVDVAGSTNLNGITDWKIGDWAIFNGTVWEKVDNTDAVTSVNGSIGGVVITTTGTAGRISVTGGSGLAPTVDIDATYVGQASITTLGTIGTGVWQGSSISTTYTDAKIKTVTGTSNRLTIGGTSTDPTFDISTSYVGQNTITTLGTVTTGTWNASLIDVIYGGTGLNAVILGDTLYGSGANTYARLPGNITTVPQIFTQTGTGVVSAAPEWLDITWIGGIFNVKDFGAAGDGVTDDKTAIEAAIAACNGQTVYFPKGTYYISSLITINKTLRLLGDGQTKTVLLATGDYGLIRFEGTDFASMISGARVEGLRFKNDFGTGVTAANAIGLYFSFVFKYNVEDCYFDGWGRCLNLVNTHDYYLRRLSFTSFKTVGLRIVNTDASLIDLGDGYVVSCVFAPSTVFGGASYSIQQVNSGGLKIDNCKFNGTTSGEVLNHYYNEPSGVTVDLLISNSSFENCAQEPIKIVTGTSSFGNVTITGNQFAYCGTGATYATISIDDVDNVVITGNAMLAENASQRAIEISNGDYISLGVNTYDGYTDPILLTSCTNVTYSLTTNFSTNLVMSGSSATNNFFNLTGTLPASLSAAAVAHRLNISTPAGSPGSEQRAFHASLGGSSTPSVASIGILSVNSVAGTDTTAPTTNTSIGNIAIVGRSSSTTTGYNYGLVGDAFGGNISVGVLGQATGTKNSATHIGSVSLANNPGTSPIMIGSLSGILASGTSLSSYIGTSAGAIVTNGSAAVDIQRWLDNTTLKLSVADGGHLTFADGVNIVAGTSTGTKIGTSTTQKLGFFNATPIVQPTGWTAPTGTLSRTGYATSTVTVAQIAENLAALITDLKALGLIG